MRVLLWPAETMRRVLASEPRYVLPLAIAASISSYLSDQPPLGRPFVILFNVAALVGVFYIFAALVYAAGKFIGGTGNARDVRAAVAWGLVPVIWAIAYRLPLAIWRPRSMLVDIGDDGFRFGDAAAGGCATAVLAVGAELIVIGWTLFVATNTVAEAHRFSWPRGLGAIAIAAVAPIVVVIAAILTTFI
jgi:hypothetical protein